MASCAASRAASASATRATSAATVAVGVLKSVWATSPATLRSISWPMPVKTGTGAERDRPGDRLVVERSQVGGRPASADDRDHVDVLLDDTPDGGDHARGCVETLDPGIGETHVEGVAARLELVDEVGVGRRTGAGHQADPQW